MKTVTFKYQIQQVVKIVALEITGRVDSMSHSSTGEEYRVVYWYNGKREAVWMYDWELEVNSK
jgi:hypothetical protein